MDVVHAIKMYIEQMIENAGTGVKTLLMDKDTISIISIVCPQSEMLQKEVYLFEAIENFVPKKEDSLKWCKCIVFVRPTEKNLHYLIRELKHPRFSQYYIYFNNIISKTDIKSLADVDEFELVKDLQEFYSDFLAINSHTFSFNVKHCYQNIKHWHPSAFQRVLHGLISVLLAINRCPLIRYQANSELAKRLAEQLRQNIAKESLLFDSTKHKNTLISGSGGNESSQPILLILDRKFDPITPLLNQWTYQAMLHELIGIVNNRISLAHVPGVSKELKEIVLSEDQDEFYHFNQYLNYGEICSNIKNLMEDFQHRTKSQKNIETIADMKSFIETYPQFKKMSGTVTKHITLIDEISQMVNSYALLEVSETEQELISGSADHSVVLRKIQYLIAQDKIRNVDAIRLVLLYAIIFANNSSVDIRGLCRTLERNTARNLAQADLNIVKQVVEFCGLKNVHTTATAKRVTQPIELLSTDNVKAFTKKMIKGFKGVENIYTQHHPLLREVLEDLYRGRLKETTYPFLGSYQQRDRPIEVIVFVIGGVTYEESMTVYQLNKTLPGVRILLGGSTVHNSASWLDEVRYSFDYHRGTGGGGGGKGDSDGHLHPHQKL